MERFVALTATAVRVGRLGMNNFAVVIVLIDAVAERPLVVVLLAVVGQARLAERRSLVRLADNARVADARFVYDTKLGSGRRSRRGLVGKRLVVGGNPVDVECRRRIVGGRVGGLFRKKDSFSNRRL